MASILDVIKHYQVNIEKCHEEKNILKCIDALSGLDVTVQHLQETGVGRTVNALRKEAGHVGLAARALVNKWKAMVAAEDSDQESAPHDTSSYNGKSKDSDDNSQSRRKHDSYEKSNSSHKTSQREDSRPVNGHHNSNKRKYSSEEDKPEVKKSNYSNDDYYDKKPSIKTKRKYSESDSYESESESDETDSDSSSSEEEVHIKQEIKKEVSDKHKSSKESKENYHNNLKNDTKKSSHSSDKHSEHHSSQSKERHSNEKSFDKEEHHSSNKHKSSKEKETSSEKKHKSDHKSPDIDKSYKESKSSSKNSSSEKHKSSSSSHKDEKHKNKSTSEKNLSKTDDKYKSSKNTESSKTEKHKSKSENDNSGHKSKDSSSSSSNKDKHSSSSKEKSNDRDRSSSSKDKSNRNSSEKSNSEIKHSSSSSKSSGSESKSTSEKSEKKSKHKSSSSDKKSSKSSSDKTKDDVPKKKVRFNGEASEDGIDCGSGASFAEALGMISPTKSKKKYSNSKDTSPTNPFANDLSPAALLSPSAKLAPLPALEISALPEISPNYKPRPPPKCLPHFTDDEAISAGISSKNQRTKVYSGNKVIGKIPSLYEMCVHILQEHIDALEYTGGVPYEILKPVVDRATPQQLFTLEHYNPYLMEDTDHLWHKFCEKNFRKQKRQEFESWREMYMRCQEEQECKLKSLTANIKIAQEAKKAPIKQTKMAYVDTVVKPPRNVARKQAQHGTAHASTASPAARVSSLSSSANVLRPGSTRPLLPTTITSSTFQKPKKAPLMQKALQFMRGRKR